MSEIIVQVSINRKTNDSMEVYLSHNDNGSQLSSTELALVLASGISLITKTSKDRDGENDYDIMKTVIDYLNNEFISLDSFKDAEVIKKP